MDRYPKTIHKTEGICRKILGNRKSETRMTASCTLRKNPSSQAAIGSRFETEFESRFYNEPTQIPKNNLR
jgi:hypothetical protein